MTHLYGANENNDYGYSLKDADLPEDHLNNLLDKSANNLSVSLVRKVKRFNKDLEEVEKLSPF